jgi:hypothetical protein
MVTTIIAIYGAVLSTVSALLGAWYFIRSGPRLQAEASIEVAIGEENRAWEDTDSILLRVWNTGRADVSVQIMYLMIDNGDEDMAFPREGSEFLGKEGGLRVGINGPKLPIRIPGHSGESWIIEGGFDTRSIQPFTSATLSIILEVGGNRTLTVPVIVMDDTYRRIKRQYILKPGSSQAE